MKKKILSAMLIAIIAFATMLISIGAGFDTNTTYAYHGQDYVIFSNIVLDSDGAIVAEALSVCPDELLLYISSTQYGANTDRAESYTERTEIIQRLNLARQRGENVYMASFYFDADSNLVGVNNIQSWDGWITRITALSFFDGVTWDIHNRGTTAARIDYARGDLFDGQWVVDSVTIRNHLIPSSNINWVMLHLHGSIWWSSSTLTLTENGWRFPVMRVNRPHFRTGDIIYLESVPICPLLLLEDFLARPRGDAPHDCTCCDMFVQRLTNAYLHGETVYIANVNLSREAY
jgi:hypothetical protein